MKNPVVTIGVFDGVHKGHAVVVETVLERAAALGGEGVIVTFWPHPRIVLGGATEKLKLLSTLEEKKERLESLGVKHLAVAPFTSELSRLSACEFVKSYLIDGLGLNHLVFGFDHHIGRGRLGSYENMKECSRLYGFTLEQVDPVFYKNERISSSSIRDALFSGDVKLASRQLGYPYSLSGKIVSGERIGRKIGFPTANMQVGNPLKLVPATGVYAVEVAFEEKIYEGMMNIGYRPTFNSKKNGGKNLEVHILDFGEDVYDRGLRVRFIDRVRCERSFSGLKELGDQLAKDKKQVREILADYRRGKQ